MAAIIFGGVIAVAIFVVDLNLSYGVAGGVPYILPVLVLTFCSEHRYILVMAAICSALTILGHLISPEPAELWVELANHGLVLFAIWVTAGFAFAYKNAAAKSAENEERYALALDGTDDGLWDRNILTGEAYFSPRWFAILGYDDNELPANADTFYELVHPDDRERTRAGSQSHLDNGVPYDIELRMRHKNGAHIWIRTRGRALYDDAGNPTRMAGAISDINQLKQMELGLRESERRLKQGQRIAHMGSWELDLTCSALTWSDEIYQIFEIDPSQFGASYEAFLDAIHPDDREMVNQAYTRSLVNRAPYQVTHRLRMPDGRIKWVEENCESEFDADGNPQLSRGTVQDITALTRAEEALRESEARYRSLIENSNLGIHIGSLTKGRLFANRACADLFGFDSPEELIASPKMALIPDHEVDRIEKFREEVFTGRATESSYEYDALRKDGSVIPLQVFMQRITWEGEEALLRTFVDLSDRNRAEEQLQQSQKMEAVGQLTGGIAHEFNNLLMVIVGNLDLTMGRVTDDKAKKFMSFAMDSAMRGAELTSKLLSFSRKQTLRAEDLDLNGLVVGMHEMLGPTIGETISVDAELAPDTWPVHADKSLLENVLLNLALNARDSMPTGGNISIATSNRIVDSGQLIGHPDIGPGDYVLMSVTDTGSGMTPDVMEHAFEPFFTTKDVGEGTGLGLSMVHGFVEQSGGFVEIESEPGEGTSIHVYLPRVVGPGVGPEPSIQGDGHVRPVNFTVLVVEDKPDVRKIVAGILSELGGNVIEAEDGRSALEYLAERRDIDLLFTDVVLPGGMSGPEIATKARRIIPGLKIVLTSGYPDGEFNDPVPDDEFPWFIRKPYRKSEIALLLDKVLRATHAANV
jgi:PAS domain S-box-containing protein